MSKSRRLLVCILLAGLPVFAQEFQAGIRGIVKDAQGAVTHLVIHQGGQETKAVRK